MGVDEEAPAGSSTERIPWKTEVRAQRLKDDGATLYKKGELLPDGRISEKEVEIFNVDSAARAGDPALPQPWKATHRGHDWAYLVEGFNPDWETRMIGGKEYFVALASKGNYVAGGNTGDEYGVYLLYRPVKDGPIGPYSVSVGPDGEPYNFVREVEDRYNLTWTGRMDMFSVKGRNAKSEREDWGLFHAVDLDTTPADFPRSGWLPDHLKDTAFRTLIAAPVNLSLKGEQPWMTISDPPLTKREIKKYRSKQ